MVRAMLFLTLVVSSLAFARATRVRSYTKKDGTLVQSHMRSAPNKTKVDNYSTKGNINPYTGKAGNK